MKSPDDFGPFTDVSGLLDTLRLLQFEWATAKEPIDRNQVAKILIWFDEQNARLPRPSKKIPKYIASIWAHYCR